MSIDNVGGESIGCFGKRNERENGKSRKGG